MSAILDTFSALKTVLEYEHLALLALILLVSHYWRRAVFNGSSIDSKVQRYGFLNKVLCLNAGSFILI
jgi:hypothetical protein